MPLRPSTRLALAVPVLAGLLLSASAAQAAVTWVRFEDPTCVDDGGTRTSEFVLQCGTFGSFLFKNTENRSELLPWDLARIDRAGDQCSPEANGREIPPTVTDQPVPAGIVWEPCGGDDCFSEPSQTPDGEWVAVIDWHTLHGRSVGHTIASSSPSELQLKLFDLAEPGVREIATLEQIGDAHILAQLCGVAQDALERPPVAVNMSFGRMDSPDRPACTPQDGELRCQIEALVDHLRDEYAVQAFAAAGNHGELTFPASAPGVVSVGSLELGLFWPRGVSIGTQHSPEDVDLLFPGYGLVLEGASQGQVWPVPPGSSYASAVATGWLSGYALSSQDPAAAMAMMVQAARSSELSIEIVGTELALRLGGSVLPDSTSEGATRLTSVALGFVPDVFSHVASQTGSDPLGLPASYAFEVQPSVLSVPPATPSLTALNGTVARPSPDSEPCVPCRLSTRRRRASVFSGAGDEVETVLELGGSGGVPADSRLLDVVLEVGPAAVGVGKVDVRAEPPARYHLSGVDYQQALASGFFEFLDGLERGSVVEVVLSNLPDLTGKTLSLRYQLLRTDGEEYWDSTPVANHLEVAPVLFSESFDLGDTSPWQLTVGTP